MAFHGCLVSDCDKSDHDHRADREIVQKTDLGTYLYIYNYIDQKMCTLYPYTYTEIYIGTFAGQSAFRIMFNLIQFYESELRSRLKSIKSLLFFKEKRSAPRACYGGARFHFTEVDCWSIPSHRRDAHLRFSRIGMSSENSPLETSLQW